MSWKKRFDKQQLNVSHQNRGSLLRLQEGFLWVRRLGVNGLLLIIRGYQVAISPLLPARCRYIPTCSEYAMEAIVRYGAQKGIRLAFKRILRCHPLGSHGYDPVP